MLLELLLSRQAWLLLLLLLLALVLLLLPWPPIPPSALPLSWPPSPHVLLCPLPSNHAATQEPVRN